MNNSKREIIGLILVLILGYGYLWYSFAWQPNLQELETVNDSISTMKAEIDRLDAEIARQVEIKEAIHTVQAKNDRMNFYLMNSSDITDGTDYIEKLDKIVGKNLQNINVSEPSLLLDEKSKAAGNSPPQFYVTKISFTTKMNIPELEDLIRYIEGGSKLVSIAECQISADDMEGGGSNDVIRNPYQSFNTNMTLHFYSQNKGSMQRFYEYSRVRFNQNQSSAPGGGTPGSGTPGSGTPGSGTPGSGTPGSGTPGSGTPGGGNQGSGNQSGGTYSSGNYSSGGDPVVNWDGGGGHSSLVLNQDVLEILFRSNYKAGDNFQFKNFRKHIKDSILFKAKTQKELILKFYQTTFSATTKNDAQKPFRVFGEIPTKDIVIALLSDVPNIPIDKNLYLSIQIENSSGRRILIHKIDTGNRVTFKDRNGNQIRGNSQIENVSFY